MQCTKYVNIFGVDYRPLWDHPALIILGVFGALVTAFTLLVTITSLVRYGYSPGIEFYAVPIAFFLALGFEQKLRKVDGAWVYSLLWYGIELKKNSFNEIAFDVHGQKYHRLTGQSNGQLVRTNLIASEKKLNNFLIN